MKLLVLYEELAWYFINCINGFAEASKCEILVICKSPASSAPFKFRFVHPSISIVERDKMSADKLESIVRNFKPTELLLGGWSYKPYLSLMRNTKFRKSVIGFDNQWNGSARQLLGSLYFRVFRKHYLDGAFVAGKKQAKFARQLGFRDEDIRTGAYCCDYSLFSKAYQITKAKKEKSFPRRFLFVGRYEPEKGISLLWKAFIDALGEGEQNWELWCAGKGSVVPEQHHAIKHLGFLQPEELQSVIAETGVFVLPSVFEPWGVVVHEFASAGFPLICSTNVGAGSDFLEDGKNGYLIEAGNQEALSRAMRKIMAMSDQELNLFATHSVFLASRNTPAEWVQKLMELYG